MVSIPVTQDHELERVVICISCFQLSLNHSFTVTSVTPALQMLALDEQKGDI